ncbi:MAG: DUF2608 domain-containing protein [Bdellovibrionales bacterium]|nr:DUF2608 domain-containing protein [Bdellovibrionales bacterium]
MFKIVLLSLLTWSVAFPAWSRESELEETPEVAVMALTQLFPRVVQDFDKLASGDLLVLDLDNTVFREAQTLGTDEWYTHASLQLTAQGLSWREAATKLGPLNFAIKDRTEMRLMESELPELIARLQKRGVAVIGLTARHPLMAQLTLRQLRALGVDFSRSSFPSQSLVDFRLPELNNDFLWDGGVAFTDGSPKGLVLKSLLNKTGFRPRRAMAVDDRIHHVHTFVEALLELRIHGRVIHYLKALEEPFEAAVADLQRAVFEDEGRLLSDAEARARLTASANCAVELETPQ